MEKCEQYKWAKPGDKGRIENIEIEQLKIDNSYQRTNLNNAGIVLIAKNFDWIRFGVLIVMERISGEKFIVDGQRRFEAVKKRGDIKKVTCIVFKSDGPAHESIAFHDLNTNRKTVTALEKYTALLMARISPYVEIDSFLKENNLFIGNNSDSKKCICFVAAVLRVWKINESVCKKTILLQKDIADCSPMHGDVFNAIAWLLCADVPVEEYIDKIKKAGGQIAVCRAIKIFAMETAQTNTPGVCGAGLLTLINKGKKNKVIINKNQ